MTDFHNTAAIESHLEPSVASDLHGHPDDVVRNTRLTVQQKRAVLASWVSDANAVPHLPTLRQLPDGSIVKVDDILRALKALDAGDTQPATDGSNLLWQKPFERRRSWAWRSWSRSGRGPGNDDDPPPCPAYAARVPRSGGGAAGAVAEPMLA